MRRIVSFLMRRTLGADSSRIDGFLMDQGGAHDGRRSPAGRQEIT